MGFEKDILLLIKYKTLSAALLPSELETSVCDKNVFVLKKLLITLNIEDEVSKLETMLKNITSLDLSNCNLVDLPSSCSNLNLKQLNLSRNKFERVPSCLYDGIRDLEVLDLSYNNISNFDREPDCIGHLKIVSLAHNSFKNIPKWFLMFKAVNLLQFSYSNNKAKHYDYLKNSYNSGINKLLKLELAHCQLIDSDYQFLRQFKHLEHLDIGNEVSSRSNRFNDLDKLFLKLQWKQLKIFKANYLDITIFPTGILWLVTLSELHVNGNFISWIPADIRYMINLEVLEVSHNHLVSLAHELTELKELRVIKAAGNHIESVPDFKLIQKLEVLDLYSNALDHVSVDLFKLELLDLENNYLNTKDIESEHEYERKKNNYRKTLLVSRLTGFKTRDVDIEDSDNSDSDHEYYYDKEFLEVTKDISFIEDWDADFGICPKHKAKSVYVDSDDDWKGEEMNSKNHGIFESSERIYVPDEDWMFEDAYEDL